jgi:hypothetical protein
MNTPRTSHLMTHQTLRIGQPVHVNVRSSWLPATVNSLAPGRIGVDYTTAYPAPLGSTVNPWLVRPADGYTLEYSARLCTGQKVVAGDGTVLTVAAPAWKGRDGLCHIEYTNGTRAALPPKAVLRLVDETPQVTVNGRPI